MEDFNFGEEFQKFIMKLMFSQNYEDIELESVFLSLKLLKDPKHRKNWIEETDLLSHEIKKEDIRIMIELLEKKEMFEDCAFLNEVVKKELEEFYKK